LEGIYLRHGRTLNRVSLKTQNPPRTKNTRRFATTLNNVFLIASAFLTADVKLTPRRTQNPRDLGLYRKIFSPPEFGVGWKQA
jgi:hypothetical protein